MPAFAARCVAIVLAGALQALLALPAQAQTAYKCTRAGSTYYSDRPCEGESKPVFDPIRPVRPESPAHWRHLSGPCRQLAERVQRVRQAAGSDGSDSTQDHLQREQELYNEQCWDDEQRARQRLVDLARDERERTLALQQQSDTVLELCSEMRRIRELRRPRLPAMTAGERADFERFEANFNRRCNGVLPR